MAECVYCGRDPEHRNQWGVLEDDWCERSPDGEHHEEPLEALDPPERLDHEYSEYAKRVAAGIKDPWS
jgi:hypothetical protein